MKTNYDEDKLCNSDLGSNSSSHSSWSTCLDSNLDVHGGGDDDDDDGDVDWIPPVNFVESDSDIKEEEYFRLDEDELKECSFFLKYNETYDCDNLLFTTDDLKEMKFGEKTMSERTERGCYRSKEDHEELYWQIMKEYSRFITRPMLLMLNHMWSTHKNEAMNTSVAASAPKIKHYSTTNILLTRVGIAGGCQVLGHATFWSMVCDGFDFKIDFNLFSILPQRDEMSTREGRTFGRVRQRGNVSVVQRNTKR